MMSCGDFNLSRRVSVTSLLLLLMVGESLQLSDEPSYSVTADDINYNLAVGKSSLQSSTLWGYDPSLAVDSDPETCSVTPRSAEQRWWQVHLGAKAEIHSVAVTITEGSYQRFTVFVIDYDTNNRTTFVKCNSFNGKFLTHSTRVMCPKGGIEGYKVYVRDDRRRIDQLKLCEVQVFGTRDTPSHVSEPASMTKCDSLSLKNGQVLFGRDPLDGVKTAVFQCSPGHILWGQSTARCNEGGQWTTPMPTCQPITCGDIPRLHREQPITVLEGAFVRGHVSKVGDSAAFDCQAGFSLVENGTSQEEEEDVFAKDYEGPILLEKVEAECAENGKWIFDREFQCLNESLVLAAISRGSSAAPFSWEYLLYFLLVLLLILVLTCLFCALVKANSRRHERNLKTMVTHPRIVEPSIASSTSSTRFLFPDFKAKDIHTDDSDGSGCFPTGRANSSATLLRISAPLNEQELQQLQRLRELQHQQQLLGEELTHLALPNGHYLTTTQPGIGQQPQDEVGCEEPPQQLTVVGLPTPSPEQFQAQPVVGVPFATFKPRLNQQPQPPHITIHPQSKHLPQQIPRPTHATATEAELSSLPPNWSLMPRPWTVMTSELTVDDEADRSGEEQMFSVPTTYNPRAVEEAINEQLMSQQPQYTNVEEALQLHQELLKKAKMPLIDEAGYASLIVTQQQQQLEILRRQEQQQQSEEQSEPNYQEIGPAKPKRQIVPPQIPEDVTYQNASAAVVVEYPDLLKRSPQNKEIVLYENGGIGGDEDDLMYAKVDMVKKQQARKTSSEEEPSLVSEEINRGEDSYSQNLEARFNDYFATGLPPGQQENEFRVSHC